MTDQTGKTLYNKNDALNILMDTKADSGESGQSQYHSTETKGDGTLGHKGSLGKDRKNRHTSPTKADDPIENLKEEPDSARVEEPKPEKSQMDQGNTVQENEENQENDGKMVITMLGASGSGKTSFLSAIYQTMIFRTYYGFQIRPVAAGIDEYIARMGDIASLAMMNSKDYAFPSSTNDTTEYKLELKKGRKRICHLEFIDYRGGAVDALLGIPRDVINEAAGNGTTGNEAAEKHDVEGLRDQLIKSDAILVFADAVELSRGNHWLEWAKSIDAQYIGSLLEALIDNRDENSPLTILLVLTKVDDAEIDDALKANNYKELCKRISMAFSTVRDLISDTDNKNNLKEGWSFGIIPVSATGNGNVEVQINDNIVTRNIISGHVPEPYNIENAMVYAIACVLSGWEKKLELEKEARNMQLAEKYKALPFYAKSLFHIRKMLNMNNSLQDEYEDTYEDERRIEEKSDEIRSLLTQTRAHEAVYERSDSLDV